VGRLHPPPAGQARQAQGAARLGHVERRGVDRRRAGHRARPAQVGLARGGRRRRGGGLGRCRRRRGRVGEREPRRRRADGDGEEGQEGGLERVQGPRAQGDPDHVPAQVRPSSLSRSLTDARMLDADLFVRLQDLGRVLERQRGSRAGRLPRAAGSALDTRRGAMPQADRHGLCVTRLSSRPGRRTLVDAPLVQAIGPSRPTSSSPATGPASPSCATSSSPTRGATPRSAVRPASSSLSGSRLCRGRRAHSRPTPQTARA